MDILKWRFSAMLLLVAALITFGFRMSGTSIVLTGCCPEKIRSADQSPAAEGRSRIFAHPTSKDMWPPISDLIKKAYTASIPEMMVTEGQKTSTCDTVFPYAKGTHYGQEILFEGDAFICYFLPACTDALRLYLCDDRHAAHLRNFSNLKEYVEQSGGPELRFAMNAGMYTEERDPVGLYIEKGELISHVDRRKGEYGNFYMQPNGILVVDTTSRISILRTEEYRDENCSRYRYATQSGPMLVIEDEINPQFRQESKSKFVRNGVGLTDNGQVVFVISRQPVNFHRFASFFKEQLCCRKALYLDGAISRVHLPELKQHFLGGDFGPLIAIVDERAH